MNETNKMEFTVDDYEFIDDLIDEAMNGIDRIRFNRLTLLKNKIYRVLEAEGLRDEVEEVIKKKWDIVELGTHNGIRRISVRKKE